MKKSTYMIWGIMLICFPGFLVVSCNQAPIDPIFYYIENELELQSSTGTPSKIVLFGDPDDSDASLYVAKGNLYVYHNGRWSDSISQPPGGKILDIGATTKYLYALTVDGDGDMSSGRIYRKGIDTPWENVKNETAYKNLSVISGAGDTLFVGSYRGSDVRSIGLLYIQDQGQDAALTLGRGSGGLLRAAAYLDQHYYISIQDQGIIKVQSIDPDSLIDETNSITDGDFLNLLVIDDRVVAAGRNGTVLTIDQGGTVTNWAFGIYCTGALAYWKDPGSGKSLLLLGRGIAGGNVNSYYTFGYYEVDYEDGNLSNFRDPGNGDPTTVSGNAKYTTSIGTRVVNSLYQVPASIDPAMPIFASTQKDGLWSCRNKEWNGEL